MEVVVVFGYISLLAIALTAFVIYMDKREEKAKATKKKETMKLYKSEDLLDEEFGKAGIPVEA